MRVVESNANIDPDENIFFVRVCKKTVATHRNYIGKQTYTRSCLQATRGAINANTHHIMLNISLSFARRF